MSLYQKSKFSFILLSFVFIFSLPGSLHGTTLMQTSTDATHPRLYLNQAKIDFLKSRLADEPYQTFWTSVRKVANRAVKNDPPDRIDPEDDNLVKNIAHPLPDVAMAYLLTGDEKYLFASVKWMDALVSYPDWADNTDVESAEALFSMSVLYDWLYDRLTPTQQDQYRDKIAYQAEILYQTLINQEKWWAKDLLQNHNYTNVMAIAVASVALASEEQHSQAWMSAARENFKRVLEVLSPDGASHEGVGYWSGGMHALLRYFKAEESIGAIKQIPRHPYFLNAPYFRLYASLPDYNEVADYADSPRIDYHGPGFILRAFASAFQDGKAQWLAETVERARGENAEYSWKDLLWYDERVVPVAPTDMPPYAFFDNLGLFLGRSNWNQDALWFLFKAGPPQGHYGEALGISAGSHIHPDEGQFSLWYKGKWLVIDDGYVLKKRTKNHNVLTFNGFGQLGEGEKWFDGKEVQKAGGTARVVYKDLQSEYQYLVADLTRMYKAEANLKRWTRTFVVLQGKYVVIKDEITLNNTGDLQSYVHFPEAPVSVDQNTLCLRADGSASMRYLLPQGDDINTDEYSIPDEERKGYGNYEGFLAKLKANAVNNTYTTFMVFSADDASCQAPYSLKARENNQVLKIKGAYETFVIDFKEHRITAR